MTSGTRLSDLRVAVYSDQTYRIVDGVVSTNRAFIRYVAALAPRLRELVIVGRLSPEQQAAPYELPTGGIRFLPLPYYRRVSSVGRMIRATRESCRRFERILDEVDGVWVFGPHPLAVAFALIARRRRVALVLGVRQDYVRYIRHRLPSRWWAWALPAAWTLDRIFRLLARGAPTVALGRELAAAYRQGAPVLEAAFSLVGRDDVVPLESALIRSWEDELTIVSVGRLDPEKNPMLLLEVLLGLRSREASWRLLVAGDGPMRPRLEEAAEARGLSGAIEFLGEVPNGRPLWEVYRRGHVFLHVSLTEGLPQVLVEAQSAGLPVVATAVGGVPDALGHGRGGLLVPPADANAAIAALERLRSDTALREGLIRAGHESALSQTLECQLDSVAEFLETHMGRRS